jgi:hypothetical protein
MRQGGGSAYHHPKRIESRVGSGFKLAVPLTLSAAAGPANQLS